MGTAEPATAGLQAAAPNLQGYVFGVDLVGSFAVPHIAPPRASGTARPTLVEPATAHEIDDRWRTTGVESLVDRRHPDGRPFMLIDQHESLGFRVWAPRHGRYEVSTDGRRVRCAVPSGTDRWERLFFAQTLPLAAGLQRIELFHASAIALDGRAVAFVAPSGSGKSSVAAHLLARGAELVTDDVLALESIGESVVAHPGANVLRLDDAELRRIPGSVGTISGEADKIHLSCRLVSGPLPLSAIYYLERTSAVSSLTVEHPEDSEPNLLLGSSFISYIRTPQFLADHLELCAHAARTVPTFRLRVPNATDAAGVAARIEAELG